jgi:hypothetical protein
MYNAIVLVEASLSNAALRATVQVRTNVDQSIKLRDDDWNGTDHRPTQ